VILARRDGTVLLRLPIVLEWIGRSLADELMFRGQPIGSQPANLSAVSPIDRRDRILAYQSTSEFPLVIAATMLRSEALAPYRDTLLWALVEGTLTIAALLAGGAIIVMVVRRRIEAARILEETGALLESVFAVTNQAIIVFDGDRRAVAWNERCADYFGAGLKLGKGAPLDAMLRGLAGEGEYGTRDVDASVAERLAAAHAGKTVRYERERPNGMVLEVGWLPLPNGYLAIAHTDITHLKQAEKSLRESEARAARTLDRLRDAVDSLAGPIFLWDAEERLVLANKAATEGLGGDTLIPGTKLVDAAGFQVRAGRFPAAVGREDAFIQERLEQIRRADGNIVEIQRADGSWLAAWDRRTQEGGIVSLRVDITRLMQTEIALRESRAQAASAHARLDDAIESLSNPFMLWDAEERLVVFNQAAVDPLSLNAPPEAETLRVGVQLEDSVRRFVFAGHVPAAVGREEEYVQERLAEIRRGDGRLIEVQLADGRWLVMRDRRMKDGGIVSLRVDITELKKREAELSEARAAADAASRAKSDFLSRMSHELRTPLNAVIGFSQMLQIDRTGNLTNRQRSYCSDIESGGRHLLALVNDVLDLARIESGTDRMSLEQVSPADALASLRTAMTAIAERSGIALSIADPVGVPDCRADDMRLHQILLNLVSNAIKYNRRGGSVDVSVEAIPEGKVRFSVADTGIGISESAQKELFEPFHRLGQEYTGIDGTGIGLSICRRLAEAMGGSIGYRSTAGVGSTFWVDVPVDTAPRLTRADVAGGDDAADAQPAYSAGGSILYVEDNLSNMRLMELLVSALPQVALLTATTPRLGLDLARVHRPDLILLDLHLPGMNGYEMLAHLKAMPETAGIPVVALTAAAMPADIRRGLAAGFVRYLTKPIDVKVFLSAIGEYLPAGSRDNITM
jgi:signal transduction histidine kinase/ActR/RegA family two-component response regulator